MSFRTLLAVLIAMQFGMSGRAHAVAYSEERPQAAAIEQDGYVLMQDVQVERFDDLEEHSHPGPDDQTLEEAVRQYHDGLADSAGDEGEEINSTVIMPAGSRFFVRDGIIDQDTGERYIQVELESGFSFWTKLSAFDHTLYVAEGMLAKKGKSAGGKITSKAGWRTHPISGKLKCHEGTDISMPKGTPVGARAGAGVVTFAGTQGGYGKVVELSHGQKMSKYAHLSKISVKVGQKVSAGQNLGRSGCTGACTGPHLHYEYKVKGTSICGGKKKKRK